MNGDTALLCPKRISPPTRASMVNVGMSHHAFLTLRNCHISPNSDLLFPIVCHLLLQHRVEYLCQLSNAIGIPVAISDIAEV